MALINHRQLYRLPWNYADNVISWLEPTKKCNIYCEGCYSANNPTSHKTLEQIKSDLDVFEKFRNTHSVSVAGGDPLCHPQIVEVVRLIAERGLQPIVNTNGFAMTEDLMRQLKDAGMKGLTFHVDSLQKRPGWEGKNEIELNELRLKFAEMAARVGGLSCAFNSTVYEETLKYVPELAEWGRQHIDIVNVMVFILFRAALPPKEYEYYAQGVKVDMRSTVYGDDKGRRTNLMAEDAIAKLREKYPDFSPCAYLNGTEDPSATKWLMTLRVGNKDGILGYFGPKFIELAQVQHHLLHGKYLGYVHPRVNARAKWMLPLGLIDKGAAGVFKKWIAGCFSHPSWFLKPLHMQSVMIIQPVDTFTDGRMSMCDGCPDMTVHEGRLVWSCRLEEPLKYGCFLTTAPCAKNPKIQEQVRIQEQKNKTPVGA